MISDWQKRSSVIWHFFLSSLSRRYAITVWYFDAKERAEAKEKYKLGKLSEGSLIRTATLISFFFFFWGSVIKVLSLSFPCVHSNGTERCSSACHSKQQDVNPIKGLESTWKKSSAFLRCEEVSGSWRRRGQRWSWIRVTSCDAAFICHVIKASHIKSTIERTVRQR